MRILALQVSQTVVQFLLTRDMIIVHHNERIDLDGSLSWMSEYGAVLLGITNTADGVAFARRMRQSNISTPVVALLKPQEHFTRRQIGLLRAQFLNSGGDDFFNLPFVLSAELAASLSAINRRVHKMQVTHQCFEYGDIRLELDLEEKTASINGAPLKLTVQQFKALEFLSMRPNLRRPKDAICGHVRVAHEVSDDLAKVLINRLRRAMGDAGPLLIRTDVGRGYYLNANRIAA